MSTPTEPLVRIVSVICENCGFEFTDHSEPPLLFGPVGANWVRERYGPTKHLHCDACGQTGVRGRIATEPYIPEERERERHEGLASERDWARGEQ